MSAPAPGAPLLLSVREAARYSGLPRDFVYELVAAKALPHLRIGRAYKIPKSALDAWVSAEAARNIRPEPGPVNQPRQDAGNREPEPAREVYQ